jgi:hypothetical protein
VNAQGTLEITGLKGDQIVAENIRELKAVWQKPLNF